MRNIMIKDNGIADAGGMDESMRSRRLSRRTFLLGTAGLGGTRTGGAAVEGVTHIHCAQAVAGARLHATDGRYTARKAGHRTGTGQEPGSFPGAAGDTTAGRPAESGRCDVAR